MGGRGGRRGEGERGRETRKSRKGEGEEREREEINTHIKPFHICEIPPRGHSRATASCVSTAITTDYTPSFSGRKGRRKNQGTMLRHIHVLRNAQCTCTHTNVHVFLQGRLMSVPKCCRRDGEGNSYQQANQHTMCGRGMEGGTGCTVAN